MKYILFIISVLFIQQINAQSIGFEISGTLISNDDKLPLESATVYLERKRDSTVISYTITDTKGKFSLEGDTRDKDLNFNISYVGYKSYQKNIDLEKEAVIDMKEVFLKPDANQLNEVVLKLSPPITVKKDTLEFNVKSFKTKQDANVEDLIKVLPGAEVDAEGNITINGKPVNRVLINGKPFFGSDPTIATRNFPKDIIEKVQVLDTKTKSQAFTGEDSDGENKTVNLVIKKENNKGVFGRTAAGIGTDNKYEYAGMYNRFDNDQKFSVLLGGNNVNSPGFSFGEVREMFGGDVSTRNFGGGQGIVTSDNAGLNYADDYGEEIEFTSNYFYSGSESDNESSRFRENILPDSRYFTNAISNTFSTNDNHSANLELDIERDSTWLINIAPSFRFSKSTTNRVENESSWYQENDTINKSFESSKVSNNSNNISADMDFTRRFGSKGAFLRLDTDFAISSFQAEDFVENSVTVNADSSKDVNRDQFSDINNSSNTIDVNLKYRQPIVANELFVELEYAYVRKQNKSEKSTYFKDEVSDEYDNFIDILSTDYRNIDISQRPEIGLSYSTDKIRFRFTSSYRMRTMENIDNLRPGLSLKRDFNNFEQDVRFRYRFSDKSSFNLRYGLRSNPPNLSYLQAFEDVSNPKNTIIGNPDLNTEQRHSFNMFYNNFDFQKRIGFYGFINASLTEDKTVSKTAVDLDALIKRTEFANVDGNYSINGRVGTNKKFQFSDITSLNVRLGVGSGYNRIVNYNNDILYTSEVTFFGPNIGFRYEWRDVMDIESRYSLSYTNNKYDVSSMTDQNFTAHRVLLNTTAIIPKGIEWSNAINYNYNANIADGFQKSSLFWNMTLSYAVLKDNGLITLKAYDLLNQNTNARRTATQNYIQDSQSTVLKQYFMLGFSWKFNTLRNRKGQRGKGDRRGREGNRGGDRRRR